MTEEYPNEHPLKDNNTVFPDEKYVVDGIVQPPFAKMTVSRWKIMTGAKIITNYDFVSRQRLKQGLA